LSFNKIQTFQTRSQRRVSELLWSWSLESGIFWWVRLPERKTIQLSWQQWSHDFQ